MGSKIKILSKPTESGNPIAGMAFKPGQPDLFKRVDEAVLAALAAEGKSLQVRYISEEDKKKNPSIHVPAGTVIVPYKRADGTYEATYYFKTPNIGDNAVKTVVETRMPPEHYFSFMNDVKGFYRDHPGTNPKLTIKHLAAKYL